VIEEFQKIMDEEALKVCRNASDRLSYTCADGVTHVDFTVCMGNRVLSISEKAVRRAMDLNRLRDFCCSVAKRLRGKTWSRPDTTPYSRQDLIREQYIALLHLVEDLLGQEQTSKTVDLVEKALQIETKGEKLTVAAKYLQLYQRLYENIVTFVHNMIEENKCQKTKPLATHLKPRKRAKKM
jgi:hypothetical protein